MEEMNLVAKIENPTMKATILAIAEKVTVVVADLAAAAGAKD